MKLDGTFLRSRVARRIFVLFLLSALIPAALIALLSFRELTALLLDQKRAELLNLSKASSMAMYERLLLVEDLLKQFQPDLASPGRFRIDPSVRAKGKIASLSVVQDHGKPPLPSGLSAALQYDLSASERDHLAAGNTLLVSVSQSAGAGRVFMMRVLTEGNPGPRYLLAELDPAFLWGDASELPYRTDMFVVSGLNQILYRSSPTLPPVASALARTNPRDARAQLEWVDNQVRHIAGYYTVFLKPHFLAAGWTVVASQPESEALHPAVAFTHLFLPVLGLAILLVGLLSATQIRRTLVPLEGLIDGTRRIASQDFGARIAVNSSDEFGELAASFNSMASRVGRQFHALTTLSEIDRVILSTLNVDRVLEMVLARLYDIVPADYVCITVADSDNPQAGRSHVQDYLNRVGPSVTRTQLTLEETEELLAAQDAFWQDRDGSTKGYLAPLAPLGAAAFFVLPVIWKGSLSGVIVLGYRERPILSPDEIAHARDFRDRLAVALSTAARDEQLYFQARYDALTALPNRLYFKDQLTQELTTAAREQACLAVLFIDIDHFKDVNDTAGHPSGDALLQEVAVRLRKCVRESDFIARLGGDEFTILVPSLIAPEAAGRTAEQIVQAMARPFIVEGQERFLSASVGIAVYPHDGRTGDELIKNADTAMYRAKATGRSRSVYFEERMNTEARARVALERELRRAIAREEFELHYQPQLDLRSGAVSGAEALVRWRHPHRDILAPFHFIGLAEELGLIEPLGRWILATASSQYRLMEAQGIHLERLSVNVSARQFRQQHFVDLVKRLIDEAAIPPHCLELEITETLLMTADHGIEGTLRAFKSMGIHLALDDFGTGYSSLAYLKQFPIDVVKIDRSFVKDLGTDTESRAICAAIIAMAHALCKEVVAEGVETEQQLAVLRNLGCDRIQGYYLAKPLPLTAFVDFVATRAGACTTP